MSLTRAQLRQAIIDNTSRTDKTTVINSALDRGLSDIMTRYEWRELRTTTDLTVINGDSFVALPTNLRSIVELRLINGQLSYVMSLRPKVWVMKRWPNPTATTNGIPLFCYEEAGSLYFLPISNATYTIRLTYNKLVTFALDSDTAVCTRIDNCLISYATGYLYLTLQLKQDAQYWWSLYEKELADAIRDDKRRPGTELQSEQFPGERPSPTINPWEDPFAGHDVR